MVVGLAKQDQIPIVECVGTITEIAHLFGVNRTWVEYLIKFDKVSARKSGGTWLVDLHSFSQYYSLYKDYHESRLTRCEASDKL